MTKEEETKEERHWKKYKTKRDNAILMMVYCALIAMFGAVILMSGLSESAMYNTLKDDEYLTDDGLAYRDMGNATYTYPVAEIDKMAKQSDWAIAIGIIVLVASTCCVLAVTYVMPERTEMHSMLCDGAGEKTHCPECGLKLSRLEKK